MNPRTQKRLAARIKETVATVIVRDLNDPRLGIVTVTDVWLSPELDVAKVYVSVLGDERALKLCLQALGSARGILQEAVARILETRRTPKLVFLHDESIDRALHVSDLIRKARSEDDAAAIQRGEPIQDEAPGADVGADPGADAGD